MSSNLKELYNLYDSSTATIHAASAWLYLPFLLFVCFYVFIMFYR